MTILPPYQASTPATTSRMAEPCPTTTGSSIGPQPLLSKRTLKKRETDRRCQRVSRERQKSRIAYLEDLVEKLQHANGFNDASPLLKQITRLQEERDELANKLRRIENILIPSPTPLNDCQSKKSSTPLSSTRALSVLSSPARCGAETGPAVTPPESVSSDPHRGGGQEATHTESPRSAVSINRSNDDENVHKSFSVSKPALPEFGVHQSMVSLTAGPLSDDPLCECAAALLMKEPELNIWSQMNSILSEWTRWPQSVLLHNDDAYFDDIVVRAVTQGWDIVEKRGNFNPMWRLLRKVDEILYFHAREPPNHLAVLYNVSLMLRTHIKAATNQITNLPPPLTSDRPGEDQCPYAARFIPWPHLRTTLMQNEHRYCSNHFWRTFISHLRFEWPSESRVCYSFNSKTGLYEISPVWANTVQDLERIGVDKHFFEFFPELCYAIGYVEQNSSTVAAPQNSLSSLHQFDDRMRFETTWPSYDNVVAATDSDESSMAEKTLASLFGRSGSGHMEGWKTSAAVPGMSYVSSRDFL